MRRRGSVVCDKGFSWFHGTITKIQVKILKLYDILHRLWSMECLVNSRVSHFIFNAKVHGFFKYATLNCKHFYC